MRSDCHNAPIESLFPPAYPISEYLKEAERGKIRCSVCKQPCETHEEGSMSAPALGVHVEDNLGTGEQIGGGRPKAEPRPISDPPTIEFNAVALVHMDESNNVNIKQVSFLTADRRTRRAKHGEVVPFSVKVGAK